MYPAPFFPHGLKEISMEFVINIYYVRFGEGGGQEKAYVLYACENVDNYEMPLV